MAAAETLVRGLARLLQDAGEWRAPLGWAGPDRTGVE